MINALSYFDNSIVGRYRTVERNIKSKSNSFYDSFLDLLENTIKRILMLENVAYDEKYTCGTLLREESIEKFFIEEMGVDDYTYSKCKDYIAKVNRHKHFNEHMISIDTVVTYMKVYYNLVSDFLKYKGKKAPVFNADYYNSIYGLTERENKELKNEVGRLKDDLETLSLENKLSVEDNEIYKALISAQEVEKLSLEDQNIELRNQLNKLKDIKINTIELKLNKALELLYNLTDSVVESRAIGIAVGKSITGQDITKTDYMKDAVEIVKQKESAFGMLNKQGQEISELSSKFSDMDINDLYESAKRHYQSENYATALKYYEHICLLRPLDWKAAFYTGLCKTRGNYSVYEWVYKVFPSAARVYFIALAQIKELKDDNERNEAFNEVYDSAVVYGRRCLNNFVEHIKKENEKSKFKIFEEEMSFIYALQEFIIKLIKNTIENCFYDKYKSQLAEILLNTINEAGGLCDGEKVTEEEYIKYLSVLNGVKAPPYKTKK